MPIRITSPDDDRVADYFRLTDVALRKKLETERGLYIAESEKVIRRALARGDRPRSFLMGERWLDDLADIVADDPRIVAILCGHAHTAATTTFAGVPVVVAPSTSSVLGTDWEGGGPAGGIPVVDYSVPPTIA